MKCRLAQIAVLAAAFQALPSVWAHAQSPKTYSRSEPARSTLQTLSFRSEALRRIMPYEIILPQGYYSAEDRYPVLYLLHGWHGDETNYTTLTSLLDEVSSYKLIVVLPRGENSWYVNSATRKQDHYADYIFNDLIKEVDAHFRTADNPSGRAIAGLSMGGYGALLLSLQHPGAFSFVGSLSGAFDAPSGIEQVLPALKPSVDTAFGEQGSSSRGSNNLFSLLYGVAPSVRSYFFLACGASDPLLESNRRLVSRLLVQKLTYEYHELPGAHTWTFWSAEIRPMLASLSNVMHVARVSTEPASSVHPIDGHL